MHVLKTGANLSQGTQIWSTLDVQSKKAVEVLSFCVWLLSAECGSERDPVLLVRNDPAQP
jgi:hypothetical protein